MSGRKAPTPAPDNQVRPPAPPAPPRQCDSLYDHREHRLCGRVCEVAEMGGIYDVFTSAEDALTQMGHYIREQQAEIELLRASSGAGTRDGWQRWAETAPPAGPVGARILAVVDGRITTMVWGKASHIPFYGWGEVEQGVEDFSTTQGSHWMPLPAPPAAPDEEEAADWRTIASIVRASLAETAASATGEPYAWAIDNGNGFNGFTRVRSVAEGERDNHGATIIPLYHRAEPMPESGGGEP